MVALDPALLTRLAACPAIAVGVSGGADSMALLHLLSHWRSTLGATGPEIHAVIVDHGLRAESATEAAWVKAQIADWPYVTPHILTWQPSPKPTRKIQELARQARHALLTQFCLDHATALLCLAHHADDQVETILMRLAAGSGLDGLGGMRVMAPALTTDVVTLVRPLLAVSHADLVAYCQCHNIAWVEDPSNQNAAYARIRLRQARDVLAVEGLTAQRLGQTAKRLQRARDALEWAVDQWWAGNAEQASDTIILNLPALQAQPLDIQLRIIQRAMGFVTPDRAYPARLEALERLLPSFLTRSRSGALALAGCRLSLKRPAGKIIIAAES